MPFEPQRLTQLVRPRRAATRYRRRDLRVGERHRSRRDRAPLPRRHGTSAGTTSADPADLRIEDVVGRSGNGGGADQHDQEISNDPHHRVLAGTAGLPVNPSMVAAAVWKLARASCSISSASATLRLASRISSNVKRPWSVARLDGGQRCPRRRKDRLAQEIELLERAGRRVVRLPDDGDQHRSIDRTLGVDLLCISPGLRGSLPDYGRGLESASRGQAAPRSRRCRWSGASRRSP